jgi:hypothetical protein
MKQIANRVGILFGPFFEPANGGDVFFQNVDRLSNRLHGIISQKTGLLITIAVRISNPTTLLSVFKALR